MIKKGLKVVVLAGKDKKKEGEVIEIDRQNSRAKVKEINMVKKHIKTTKEKKGGIVSKESFIHISNLKLVENKKISKKGEVKAVSYSNKLKPQIEEWHKKFNVTEYVKMKSSLKFCVIASGEFDLYVAEPRACEWDIAAGHAILQHAGGLVTDFESKEILYGKNDFKNPSLILRRSNLL